MIVFGLGNPGLKYRRTRHNVGFMLIDRMLSPGRTGKRTAKSTEYRGRGTAELFVKPRTYMNLSGLSVKDVLQRTKRTPADIIVCHDDKDIPLGEIRVKHKGGAAGHNGIQSIIDELKTDGFARVRIGISRLPDMPLSEYVLEKFSEDEIPELEKALATAEKAVMDIAKNGIISAQNKYNKKAITGGNT